METRPDLFSQSVKWAFNPEGRGPHILRTLFVVCPGMMLPVTLLTHGFGHHFWNRYIYSVLLGDFIALTCTIFAITAGFAGRKILKAQVKRRTFALASAAGMGPGMWLGFKIVDPIAAYFFHIQPDIHDLSDYGSGFMIGGLFLTVITLADLWVIARNETEKLQNETLQAKLSALSAQINPHMLFNALNTIASTIPSDPKAAEETTLKLSELYRGILTSSRRTSHTLGEELDLCRAYLGIEKARFTDRLSWSIEAEPETLSIEIPALLIQPLVENAVKHGISQKASGGKITLRVRREFPDFTITVEDDGVGLGHSTSTRGTGTGLSSCRSRLELVYQGRASVEISSRGDRPGTRVRIRIPERQEVLT